MEKLAILGGTPAVRDVPEDLFSCQGHDGQEIYIIPSQDLVVVVLGYSPKPDRVIDFNALLRDIIAAL